MSDVKSNSKKKKNSAVRFALKKLLKLWGATAILITAVAVIIATIFLISFRESSKQEEYIVKLRTQHQTKAVTVKVGDPDIVNQGYLPLSALNGIVGVRVIGDNSGITVSNPSGTEVLEIIPEKNIISVNGSWKQLKNVVLYKSGECYLPIELIEKYTCLSVSYDETTFVYTVSSVGTKDISFFPKNTQNDKPI